MERKLLSKWEELNDQLLNFIRGRIENSEDAEDMLQEIYIKVHSNIHTLRDEEKMVSWIYQITRNTIKNCYKTCHRVKSIEFEEEHGGVSEWDGVNFNPEVVESMKRFMEELPEDYQEIIRLHDFEGLTHKEIGQRLGISENTSKSKLKRGKERLRKLLDDCCTFQIDRYGNILDYRKK